MTIVTPMYMYPVFIFLFLFFLNCMACSYMESGHAQMPQSWFRVSVPLSGFVGHALACTHCSPMLTSSTVQVPEAAATVEEQEGSV